MESDEELMQGVARGDERCLERLVERHSDRLHALLARLSGDASEAEDLQQETWIRVVRGARSFDPERRFRPWLVRIAANLARDRHRRRRVREDTRASLPGDSRPDPVARLDLHRRLAALSGPLREVLLLRYYGGLSESEVAAALEIPVGTVKSRTHHALRRLRRGEESG